MTFDWEFLGKVWIALLGLGFLVATYKALVGVFSGKAQ